MLISKLPSSLFDVMSSALSNPIISNNPKITRFDLKGPMIFIAFISTRYSLIYNKHEHIDYQLTQIRLKTFPNSTFIRILLIFGTFFERFFCFAEISTVTFTATLSLVSTYCLRFTIFSG